MKKLSWLLIVLVFALLPDTALAAKDDLPWWGVLLLVSSISTVISVFLVWKNKKLETFTEKAMGFGAWFWFVIFLQIMVYGFYLWLTK